jgi:hypothetical protein
MPEDNQGVQGAAKGVTSGVGNLVSFGWDVLKSIHADKR